jgi:hypothetical protein
VPDSRAASDGANAWRRRIVLDEMLAGLEPELTAAVRKGLARSMRDPFPAWLGSAPLPAYRSRASPARKTR